jgi:hypothetical protein
MYGLPLRRGFERLVDAVGGTRDQTMGNPFIFHFRVPADAVPGASRLRVVTYRCQVRKPTDGALSPCRPVIILDLMRLTVTYWSTGLLPRRVAPPKPVHHE